MIRPASEAPPGSVYLSPQGRRVRVVGPSARPGWVRLERLDGALSGAMVDVSGDYMLASTMGLPDDAAPERRAGAAAVASQPTFPPDVQLPPGDSRCEVQPVGVPGGGDVHADPLATGGPAPEPVLLEARDAGLLRAAGRDGSWPEAVHVGPAYSIRLASSDEAMAVCDRHTFRRGPDIRPTFEASYEDVDGVLRSMSGVVTREWVGDQWPETTAAASQAAPLTVADALDSIYEIGMQSARDLALDAIRSEARHPLRPLDSQLGTWTGVSVWTSSYIDTPPGWSWLGFVD